MSLVICFKTENERIELLNAWRPYNLKVQLYFWLTWIHELVGHIVAGSVHVSSDTLIPGLMIQLSCQLKFLHHRLNIFPREIETISNSDIKKRNLESHYILTTVKHHNMILE